MGLIRFVTSIIRLIVVGSICLVILITPSFVLVLIPSNTRKSVLAWLALYTKGRIGRKPSPDAETPPPSLPTSPDVTPVRNIVAELQKSADDAARYNKQIGELLQSIAILERFWQVTNSSLHEIPMGSIGFFATLHVRMQLGTTTTGIPDPTYTRERYMTECGNVYDTLLQYHLAPEGTTDENDHRPDGAGTKRRS